MRSLFNIFSHASLGLNSTSPSLIPLRTLNAAQTQFSINAATGNVVVEDKQWTILDDDISFRLGMIWNSLEKKWKMNIGSKLSTDQLKKSILITSADGKTTSYQYNVIRKCYICDEITPQGRSTLSVGENGQYTCFYPSSGVNELYDSEGFLQSTTYPSGKKIAYQYSELGEITTVILPSKRQLQFKSIDDKTRQLILLDPIKGDSQPLANYVFDKLDNASLTTQIIQPDNKLFTTQYIYNNNALEIKSDDQTGATFNFDKSGIIKSLFEGLHKSTLKIVALS